MMPSVGLDIGHGANTWEKTSGKGVKVNGKVYEEHTFNANLGIELEKELKRHGIEVHKIQEPFQNEVPLKTRTDFYNRKNVDAVISLHANYNSNPAIKGVCVFGWGDHEPSQRLQTLLLDEFRKVGLDTHGSGDHDSEIGSWTELAITRDTKMTSCLIENGFMGNPADFQKLFIDTDEYVKQLVPAYTKAMCRFFNISYKREVTVANKDDVKGHWAEKSILKAKEKDILNGYSDGSFRPNEPVKRGELAAILDRLGLLD
jgi:N-acetylmuramoyl-L-alanine amidase